MAKGYRGVPRDQLYLMPPDRRDWLPADHPVWLVITAVEDHLDTSAFHAFRRTGGAGAAGYDPDLLVTLLVWAYANKVTSSRRIEQLCRTDAAFMVICAGNHPDHVTIARFRAQSAGAMASLFAEVLGLCARLGMGKLGVVALDGTKVAANASKSANRSLARLRELAKETVAEHAAADAAEDAAYGPGRRGDEVPPEVRSPQSRAAGKIRDAKIGQAVAEMEAEAEAEAEAARAGQAAKTAAFRARKAAGQQTGPAPAGSAAELAQEKVGQAIAEQQARIDDWNARDAADRAAGGPGLSKRTRPKSPASQYCRVREAEAERDRSCERDAARARKPAEHPRSRNITDPDSRLMPVRGGGFTQGYNTQNVTSEDGLIIATEVTDSTGDVTWLEPMLAQAEAAAEFIASRQPPAGPGQPDGPATAAMAERLKTPEGIAAYRQRGHIAETPHGNIKHNLGFRQFTLRGKPKVTAEWNLITATHNLFKAITSGHLTTGALAAL